MTIRTKISGDLDQNFYKYTYSAVAGPYRRYALGDKKVDPEGNTWMYVRNTNATTALQEYVACAWSNEVNHTVLIQSCGQGTYIAGLLYTTLAALYYGWMLVDGKGEAILAKNHNDVAAGDLLALSAVAGKVTKLWTGNIFGVPRYHARALDTCTTTNSAFTVRMVNAM